MEIFLSRQNFYTKNRLLGPMRLPLEESALDTVHCTGADRGACVYNLVLSSLTPVSKGISKRHLKCQGTYFYLRLCSLSSPSVDLYHILPEISDPASL